MTPLNWLWPLLLSFVSFSIRNVLCEAFTIYSTLPSLFFYARNPITLVAPPSWPCSSFVNRFTSHPQPTSWDAPDAPLLPCAPIPHTKASHAKLSAQLTVTTSLVNHVTSHLQHTVREAPELQQLTWPSFLYTNSDHLKHHAQLTLTSSLVNHVFSQPLHTVQDAPDVQQQSWTFLRIILNHLNCSAQPTLTSSLFSRVASDTQHSLLLVHFGMIIYATFSSYYARSKHTNLLLPHLLLSQKFSQYLDKHMSMQHI